MKYHCPKVVQVSTHLVIKLSMMSPSIVALWVVKHLRSESVFGYIIVPSMLILDTHFSEYNFCFISNTKTFL